MRRARNAIAGLLLFAAKPTANVRESRDHLTVPSPQPSLGHDDESVEVGTTGTLCRAIRSRQLDMCRSMVAITSSVMSSLLDGPLKIRAMPHFQNASWPSRVDSSRLAQSIIWRSPPKLLRHSIRRLSAFANFGIEIS
jgi:hypothetical protein